MDLQTQTIQVFQEGVQLCSPMGPDNEGVNHIPKALVVCLLSLVLYAQSPPLKVQPQLEIEMRLLLYPLFVHKTGLGTGST